MTDDMWQADAKPHGPRGTKGVIITILKVCFRDDAGFASLRPSRHDPVVWGEKEKKAGRNPRGIRTKPRLSSRGGQIQGQSLYDICG
jgi:hypothetical protein